MIRDLLNPSSGFLDLREDSKGVIQVAGITEVSTINAQEVRQPLKISITPVWLDHTWTRASPVCRNFFSRSWNCWWRETSSAPRSLQRPIRRHPAPTRCCRWPSSSRAAVVTCCRRSASHASSWSTSPAPNGQRRCVADGVRLSWIRFSFGLCAGVQFLKAVP